VPSGVFEAYGDAMADYVKPVEKAAQTA
jgi:hypothetical protein